MDKSLFQKISSIVGTPVFIYDEKILVENVSRIFQNAQKYSLENRIKLYIAYFCNSNPHLFKILDKLGCGIVVQTPEEYFQLQEFGLEKNIIISPTFLSDEEIDFWVSKNIRVNLASLEEVNYFTKKYPNIPVNFRLDLTFGSKQRMSIKKYQIQELLNLLANTAVVLNSFHTYAGTSSVSGKMKSYTKKTLKTYKKYFNQAKEINFGSGFGFNYDELNLNKKHFDWGKYFSYLSILLKRMNIPQNINFILEPGREIFVDAGFFLISVKRIVEQGRIKNISTDGSYVYMPSAFTKNRKHLTTFYDKEFNELKERKNKSVLSGCTTLSNDYVFPGTIFAPNLNVGNYILIHDIGAYGATQHMEFLNKKPCPEVLIDKNNNLQLITKRGDEADKIRYVLKNPEIL